MFLTLTEGDKVKLLEVIEFLLVGENIFVAGQQWIVGEFNNHFLAFEAISKTINVSVVRLCDIDGPPVSVHYVTNKLLFRKNSVSLSIEDEDDIC